jgi:agmatine deiminase
MANPIVHPTPRDLGYRFPAEWHRHRATWLSYPHADSYSWPGTLQNIFPFYNSFIKEISLGEQVCINVRNEGLKDEVMKELMARDVDMSKIDLLIHPTNNAWGDKYPHELDELIPGLAGKFLDIPVYYPGIVMEGGAVDFNGEGTLLTTTACLLHENRNPGLLQHEIVDYLMNYYGVEQVLWLDDGIEGDDTNGHIDDMTRFFKADGVITMVEFNRRNPNHGILGENLKKLKTFRLLNGKQLDIAEIPMPGTVVFEGQRLPASYANFYISNNAVIVPLYRCRQDEQAMRMFEQCFPSRKVVGIDSVEIIWGLGSWHCLSQQEPESNGEMVKW